MPDLKVFKFGHQCEQCRKYSARGLITYSDVLEQVIFFCEDCMCGKERYELPAKTKFRNLHICKDCYKRTHDGLFTWCRNCEKAEFICLECISNWFRNQSPYDDGIIRGNV